MSKVETIQIQVERYRTPDGQPTCSLDIREGQFCKFLRAVNFGVDRVCNLHDYAQLADYKGDGLGYLKPCERCEVWK